MKSNKTASESCSEAGPDCHCCCAEWQQSVSTVRTHWIWWEAVTGAEGRTAVFCITLVLHQTSAIYKPVYRLTDQSTCSCVRHWFRYSVKTTQTPRNCSQPIRIFSKLNLTKVLIKHVPIEDNWNLSQMLMSLFQTESKTRACLCVWESVGYRCTLFSLTALWCISAFQGVTDSWASENLCVCVC